MSPDHGQAGAKIMAGSAFLLEHKRPRPSVGVNIPPTADPRRHSMVCCCLLCEQHDAGEQAMRSVGGDYGQFLTFARSAALQVDEPARTDSTVAVLPPSRCTSSPTKSCDPSQAPGVLRSPRDTTTTSSECPGQPCVQSRCHPAAGSRSSPVPAPAS